MTTMAALLALAALLLGAADGFAPPEAQHRSVSWTSLSLAVDPQAQAFTDYMAKSHEEKLRAVKAVEDRKNAEIRELKQEIAQLKQQQSSLMPQEPLPVAAPGSMEELQAKLTSYQQFMSKYVVKAQEEKLAAVKTAVEATTKKYEEKLAQFVGPSETKKPAAVATPTPAAASTPAVSTNDALYQQRNAMVSAAGKAGKSRWGEKEVQKATQLASSVATTPLPTPTVSTTPSSTSSTNALYQQRNVMVSEAGKAGKSRWGDMEVNKATELAASAPAQQSVVTPAVPVTTPPEVVAADHGLRADGSVGGPSLAERVANGAGSPPSAVTTQAAPAANGSLYQQRNAMVSEAGKAGSSRWGDMEVQKATQLSSSVASAPANVVPVTTPPEVAAADHGLRADGSVGGPSLAERVNLGSQLNVATATSTSPPPAAAPATAVSPSNHGLYQQRNAVVSAAGKAGKSRWGEKEVQKATQLAAVATAVSAEPAVLTPDSPWSSSSSSSSVTNGVNLGAQLLYYHQ